MHFEPSSSRGRVYIPAIVWLKRRHNGAEEKSDSGAVKEFNRFYAAEEKYVISYTKSYVMADTLHDDVVMCHQRLSLRRQLSGAGRLREVDEHHESGMVKARAP